MYVIETNLMQRSFTDLLPSEKAAVLAERYDKVLYHRHREDIVNELQALEGSAKGGHDVHLSKNRDGLGEEYGLSGRSVARLLGVNELVPELKEKLDAGELNLVTAVQLSYVAEDVQKAVAETGKPISKEMVTRLRESEIKVSDVAEIVCGTVRKAKTTSKAVKIPTNIYERYLKGKKADAVEEIITKALEAWFDGKGEADV